MEDINKILLPNIKYFCYATIHKTDSFCTFMKDIKSNIEKFDNLANVLAGKVYDFKKDIDILLPVPKFKEELNEPDFSLRLAELISKKTNIPIGKDLIKKIKKTRKLKAIPIDQRKKEIENAFQLNDINFKGKKICIVDDVFSSGNTIKEIIKTLSYKYDTADISVAILVVQEN